MKRTGSFFLALVLMFSFLSFDSGAASEAEAAPYVIDFSVTVIDDITGADENSTRATGLIFYYDLSLSNNGTTLTINGITRGTTEVVKTGFKNLTVQRRKTASDSWQDYYEYGNVYIDSYMASVSTKLAVVSGYQYRLTCKHYAKKNILSVQTISNTSNSVTV